MSSKLTPKPANMFRGFKFFSRLSAAERKATETQIKDKAKDTTSFYIMVIISTLIISAGLITDNAAVVIGGMIIAPLIWPLLAISIAVIHWRKISLRKNLYTLCKTLIVILAISFLLGLLYPLYELSGQVLLRTEPNVVDLIIAVAAGLGGAFATVYSKRSPTIFGVAVAVALVPPLCTMGILLGNGHLNLVGGALLLFLTNLMAVLISAMLVFILAKFSGPSSKEAESKRKKAITYSLASFLLISFILMLLTWNVVDLAQKRTKTKELFTEMFPNETLQSLQIVKSKKSYTISGRVYSDDDFSKKKVKKFNDYLSQRLNKTIYIDFTVIKVDKINTSAK